jgi:hypothetical protein
MTLIRLSFELPKFVFEEKKMKYLIGFLLCIFGFLLIGCESQTTTTAAYSYVMFQDNRYVLDEGNTYRFGEQTITVDIQDASTYITASFLEGTVIVSSGGSVVIVDYPDGCRERYEIQDDWAVQTRFVADGHSHASQMHLALAHITVLSSADDPEEPVYWSWNRAGLIAFGAVCMLVTGIFVFWPSRTEKLIIRENRVFPMFEEPVRPTELNLVRRYLGILIAFLLSLVIFLYGLFY